MVSIPIHIGICIFYPLINYYLCFLKNSLRKKRKIADSLMERQSYFLENLGQGFMVIDHKGLIQEGATHVTKEIFGENPEGKHFGDLLRLTKEKREVLNKWLHNIWRGALSFKDLIPLAPQFFQNNEGRFIELHYKPIYVYGSRAKIDKFICVAIDKTHEISLKKQLERDKQNAYFIKACLQNPMDFIDLLRDSYELLETYPIIFEMDEKEIFRKFHTLKARYGQFGIKDLSSLINDVESVISRGDINDLIMKVDAFEKELKSFVKKNGLIIESAKKSSVEEGGGIDVKEIIKIGEEFNLSDHYLKHIRENYLLSDLKRKFIRYGHLVDELGEKQGKVIDLKIKGDKIRVDTHKYSNFIHTSIHLFRNMVDHGIEPEDERIEKNKPPRGNIEVDFKKQDDSFLITLKDNGRGIDPNKIKQKVLDIKLKSEKELENLKGPELINLIFLPGLSTMEKITEISGRGVGMDAVREEIERLGGEIKVTSVLDEGTTFFIKLPFLG
jgi:two-component system chemotaxis sensor kinase CheA